MVFEAVAGDGVGAAAAAGAGVGAAGGEEVDVVDGLLEASILV